MPCKSMLKVDKSNLPCPLIRDVSSLPLTIAVCSCGSGEIMGAGAERNEKDAGWYSVALPLLSLGGLQNDGRFFIFPLPRLC